MTNEVSDTKQNATVNKTLSPTEGKRSNVCAFANVVLTRWRAFKLLESSCLSRVIDNHTS